MLLTYNFSGDRYWGQLLVKFIRNTLLIAVTNSRQNASKCCAVSLGLSHSHAWCTGYGPLAFRLAKVLALLSSRQKDRSTNTKPLFYLVRSKICACFLRWEIMVLIIWQSVRTSVCILFDVSNTYMQLCNFDSHNQMPQHPSWRHLFSFNAMMRLFASELPCLVKIPSIYMVAKPIMSD